MRLGKDCSDTSHLQTLIGCDWNSGINIYKETLVSAKIMYTFSGLPRQGSDGGDWHIIHENILTCLKYARNVSNKEYNGYLLLSSQNFYTVVFVICSVKSELNTLSP